MIGVMFWGSIVLYLNTVYGGCVLSEIPEGYEPRYWEYEDKPIMQIFAKYFGSSMLKDYERTLGMFEETRAQREWKFQEERAHHLIYERGDYKAWYYIPYKAKWTEYTNWYHDKIRENWSWEHENVGVQTP